MTEREPKEIDSKVFDSIRLWIASRNDTTKAGLMVLTDLVDQLELDFQKERREREAAQRLAGSIDRLHTQGMKDFEAMKERAESAEKRVSEVERELDRTKIKAASGMLRDEVVEANHYRIKALEAALREAQSALHESFVCTGYHNIGESSYYEQVLAVIKAALYLKSAEAHESAPKDRVILLDNGGSLLSQPPKPPAPGASEAPECAHVDTLGRGKCDRCGLWEEEYRPLIEPKAKDSSVQKALDENMKKHDGVMRELEDKELGELAAMPELEKMQCLLCMGKGKLAIPDGVNKVIERGPCNYCNGTGEVWVSRRKK